MPRDSSPIDDPGVAGQSRVVLSKAALQGRALSGGPGISALAVQPGLSTMTMPDRNFPESDRAGVRVSCVTLSSIMLPDITRPDLAEPRLTPECCHVAALPASGMPTQGGGSEGEGRTRRRVQPARRSGAGAGSPELRWTGRYGRKGDYIRLIGWDVAPSGLQGFRRSLQDGQDSAKADITVLREICRRMAPVGGHYRASLTLTDPLSPDEPFVLAMQAVFAETGFSPQALRLVLDERRFTLAGRDEALCLAVLVDWGVELWVGRFGQGVSSLTLLRERAGTGLIAGVSLEAGLVSAPSGLWRLAHHKERQSEERLDPIAARFFSTTCEALQALGIRTHFARISSSAHYGFALAAGFDEMSGLCPELEGIAMEAEPPCA